MWARVRVRVRVTVTVRVTVRAWETGGISVRGEGRMSVRRVR